jgi:methylphosphotriester-DNA--protein-cysteine methyltransferase
MKTGEKYHTERCASVRNSKIAVSLGEAVSKEYEPCKRCKPPVLD